jgi:hypothetical protein
MQKVDYLYIHAKTIEALSSSVYLCACVFFYFLCNVRVSFVSTPVLVIYNGLIESSYFSEHFLMPLPQARWKGLPSKAMFLPMILFPQ